MWSDKSFVFFNLTSNHLIFLHLKLVNKKLQFSHKETPRERKRQFSTKLFILYIWSTPSQNLKKNSFLQSQCHEKILESKMVILFLFYIFLYKIKFSCPSGHSEIKNSLSWIFKKKYCSESSNIQGLLKMKRSTWILFLLSFCCLALWGWGRKKASLCI